MGARAFTAGLGLWNVVVNRLLPEHRYVGANVIASGVSYLWARSAGATDHELGTEPALARAAGRWAGGAAAMTALGVVLASRLPATAPLFNDARAQRADVAYQALVRIPLGTVLLEEVAFRGVLPRFWSGPGERAPSVASAALFGLWHVLPTLTALEINDVRAGRTRAAAVFGGVAVTALGGLTLDKIGLYKKSVLAPMLIHWSANSVSYVVAARRHPR